MLGRRLEVINEARRNQIGLSKLLNGPGHKTWHTFNIISDEFNVSNPKWHLETLWLIAEMTLRDSNKSIFEWILLKISNFLNDNKKYNVIKIFYKKFLFYILHYYYYV